MLETLTIKNFALITEMQIDFSIGFTILTGETGAGKSILVGALGLLLGEKGDTTMIRTGCSEAVVTATVIVESPPLLQWLEEHHIVPEDGQLLIKRSLRSTGRGAISIQDEPVTRNLLRELSSMLFDLHGQHEHQSLLQPSAQRKMLDRYGNLEQEIGSFSIMFHELLSLREQLEELRQGEREMLREREMLSFAVQEIDDLAIDVGEDEELEAELKILSGHERLLEAISTVKGMLSLSNGSLSGISRSTQALEDAAGIDPVLQPLVDRLESVRYELEDVLDEVRHYADRIAFSPERLDQIQERMQLLRQMKKKYGSTLEEVLKYRDEASDKLERIEHHDEQKGLLIERISTLNHDVRSRAEAISERRRRTARELEPLIMEHLSGLGMPNARFAISITPKVSQDGSPSCTANGADTIEFTISANLGEPEKSIRQTASGGELSRIMLALKTVFSRAERIETLIFDEIDTGIGGTVAVSVGEHLHALAEGRQVLCISHLASVAAKADHHLVVEKSSRDRRTETNIYAVTGEQRIEELARMLSGSTNEDTALDHARTLVNWR
jgi:DNA repair protein RecN (Recombination protein N)